MRSGTTTLYAQVFTSILTHRKFIALEPAAIGLWTMGCVYCWEQFTDGVIPRAAVPRLVATTPARAFTLAARLVAARLWEASGDTFQVHDWLEHNAPAAEFLAKRQAERDRKKNARRRGRDTGRPPDTPPDVHRTIAGRPNVSGSGSGIYPPIGSLDPGRTQPPVGGNCAQRDRQAGRAAGDCAMSFQCPRYVACRDAADHPA